MTEPKHPLVVRVTVYRDKAREWRWRGYAANEKQIDKSSEGYTNLEDATEAAQGSHPDALVEVDHPGADDEDEEG